GELALVDREEVARDREAERRLLLQELLPQIPAGHVDVGVAAAARRLGLAKEARLRRRAFGLLGCLERAADGGQQLRALRVERVERARAHQRLDDAPVDHALVDAPAEVEQIDEGRLAARLDDRLDRALARAAHGAQAVADAL